jgi:hypothetical protein
MSCGVPFNAQGVQDEFVSPTQLTTIEHDPERITNKGIARDAPPFVTADTCAVTAS